MSKILMIDNYDSFTYNLVHYLESVDGVEVEVMKNDQIDFSKVEYFDKIVLSPGPGLPAESGDLMKFINQFASNKPMLGVCLGHQALAQHFGAKLKNLSEPTHGITSKMKIVSDNPIFKDLPNELEVGRYHSWVVDSANLPDAITIIGTDISKNIMAIRHHSLPIYGIQFHPESILTPLGLEIIKNWLAT